MGQKHFDDRNLEGFLFPAIHVGELRCAKNGEDLSLSPSVAAGENNLFFITPHYLT